VLVKQTAAERTCRCSRTWQDTGTTELQKSNGSVPTVNPGGAGSLYAPHNGI
jgi:hypothetical protein